LKPVGRLEGGECRRAFDELRRRGELEPAAVGQVARQIVEALALGKARQIAPDRDDPGIVGRRRFEPHQMVLGPVEPFYLGIAKGGVLPGRIGFAVEEHRAVAGVFGIEVDLPGEQGRAHDVGRPELDLALDAKPARFEHRRDHVPEQRALGVDLRGDDDRPGRSRRSGGTEDDGSRQQGGGPGFRDRRHRRSGSRSLTWPVASYTRGVTGPPLLCRKAPPAVDSGKPANKTRSGRGAAVRAG